MNQPKAPPKARQRSAVTISISAVIAGNIARASLPLFSGYAAGKQLGNNILKGDVLNRQIIDLAEP